MAFLAGSAGHGGEEERGLQRGAAGEAVLSTEPVHLPAPQGIRQDPATGGQRHTSVGIL